ncbi:MAG: hypothetical protein ACTS3F_08910 [Phycisphaerales bacterium]
MAYPVAMPCGHDNPKEIAGSERTNRAMSFGATVLQDDASRKPHRWGWSAGVWLAAIPIVPNGLALAVGMGDGGAGWVSGFVVVFLLAVLVALPAAIASSVLAIVQLIRRSGRDVIAWCVLLAALASFVMSGWLHVYAVEEVGYV